MDALDVAIPEAAAVSVSKLMGSECLGGGSGAGVKVGGVDSDLSEGSWMKIRPSVDACSKKALSDKVTGGAASDAALWNKVHNAGRYAPNGQETSFRISDTEDVNIAKTNGSISLITGREAIELHRRSAKVARGSKRSRILQTEIPKTEPRGEDIKSNSIGVVSGPEKNAIAEKTQIPRQKNNANGKRREKRNGRVHKNKLDAFSLKNGLVNFSSVVGGGNCLAYGSKSNYFDATKHVDELPLNELLDGSYNCPSLVKEKGKEIQNPNENLLNSVNKAYFLLHLRGPVHTNYSSEKDHNYNQKVSFIVENSGASLASGADGGKGDCINSNEAVSPMESCRRITLTPAPTADPPMYPPKDILERLALPPSKELDSLLLDAMKPASASRNSTDMRSGKAVSHRTSLPPFSWSHNSSGQSKSCPDTVKLSANRTTCQGRWVKVDTPTLLKDGTCFQVDLKSLTYDHSLVPIVNNSGSPEEEISSSKCGNIGPCDQDLLSSEACSASQVPPAAEYSPRLLAAADILCEIASHSSKQNRHGITKLLKKSSEKPMKACKSKLNEKSEQPFAIPKAPKRADYPARVVNGTSRSKKQKLLVEEKTLDVPHKNSTTKVQLNWSGPRSDRPSPSKLFRDSVSEAKCSHNNTVRKSYNMMPPTSRVLDKGWSSQQKPKKMVPMEWSPSGSKLDR